MKITGSSYFLMLIMAVMILVVNSSIRMESLDSKLLPLLVGGIVFVLSAIQLLQELFTRDPSKAAIHAQEGITTESDAAGFRNYFSVILWVVGFILSVYLVGFHVSIPLFVFAYMKFRGTRLSGASATAVITSVFIYGVFELVIRVTLYRGLLFK